MGYYRIPNTSATSVVFFSRLIKMTSRHNGLYVEQQTDVVLTSFFGDGLPPDSAFVHHCRAISSCWKRVCSDAEEGGVTKEEESVFCLYLKFEC